MKRILPFVCVLLAGSTVVTAQDAALVERVNRLSGYVEELLTDKARQQKQILDLTREVKALREQLARRADDSANRADLQALAESVKEIDRKREADKKLILAEMNKIAKEVDRISLAPSSAGKAAGSGEGYWQVIEEGHTLSAIAAEYRKAGVKVTVEQILKANQGLDPKSLQVGQKIWIPAP